MRDEDAFSALPESQPVKLKNLDKCHCRWPLGNPRQKEFRFCGAPKMLGSPYCEAHHKMSRGIGSPSERNAHKVVLE